MKFIKKLLGLILSLLLIAGIVFLWLGRQEVVDWYYLRNYSPPVEVVTLANQTTMTEYGRRVFYVNHPYIAPAGTINSECGHESSIVLGCYTPDAGIFIYNVTDQRLDGIKEVTAAHEMLHAAYFRLSEKQRTEIDALTEQAYKNITKAHIKENVEDYRKQDPSVVPNELHSILATEASNLPPKLEEYYKKYFKNRSTIVAFSDRYQAEFSSRQQKVADYDKQLDELKATIDGSKTDLAKRYKDLMSEKSSLDMLLSKNQIAQYNQGVPSFNFKVNQYNDLVKQVDSQINQYNEIVTERNKVSVEVKDLAQSIDSRPQSF